MSFLLKLLTLTNYDLHYLVSDLVAGLPGIPVSRFVNKEIFSFFSLIAAKSGLSGRLMEIKLHFFSSMKIYSTHKVKSGFRFGLGVLLIIFSSPALEGAGAHMY